MKEIYFCGSLKSLKVYPHHATAAASAWTLTLTLGMGLEPIFHRQHQRQPVSIYQLKYM